MPGLFIDVEVDAKLARDRDLTAKLVEVCPVNIFAKREDGSLQVVEENLDECVLCDLCVEAAPAGAVRIKKPIWAQLAHSRFGDLT